jgi:DNA invertase Pin-like site-specific DNA recombinase
MVSIARSRARKRNRIALYLRSATIEQGDDPAASLAGQRKTLLGLAARHDLQIVGEYEDTGISGLSRERPGLDRLLQDACAKPRQFDFVLVDDLARISRDTSHLMEVATMLKGRAIALVTADQLASTLPPSAKLCH